MNNQNTWSARAPWKKLFLGLALTVERTVRLVTMKLMEAKLSCDHLLKSF